MDALENYMAVTKGFKILIRSLGPYIAREFQIVYGDDWWNIAVIDRLYEDQRRDLPISGDYATLVDSLDEQRCLLLMEINWREVFGRKLPRECKNWVIELKGNRTEWAHCSASGMSESKSSRMLDTMQLLCEYIDPDDAEEIRVLLRKVRYGSEDGSMANVTQVKEELTSKPRKVLAATVEAEGLPSWREIMEPHPDVAQGRYRNAEFAADLAQVAHGEGSIEYRDPVEFFARTYLTKGLEDLLTQAILRVSGAGGEPVVQLKTAFGGGKTHSMLALYHLLRGKAPLAKIPSLQPVLEKTNAQVIADGVHVVVLVGTALDVSKAKKPQNMRGITVNTLWGEMAYQLAVSAEDPSLYEYVREADKKGVSPGSRALTYLFNACGPCLILMDEIVAYARKLDGGKNLPAGDLGNFLTFVQEISEAARASESSMVVASIPESDMEIGGEAGQKALDAIEHTFGRMEAIWKPVAADEGFEVVRRRLFLDCKDPDARDRVCDAYSHMYNENPTDFPIDAKSLDYRNSMVSCYPIHPEVFSRLYEDWATLPMFQRTRGVLRLMAAVIHDLWMNKDDSAMIMPGSLPLSNSVVRDELTRYLDASWNGIVDSEIDGKSSVPYKNDEATPRYGQLLASRRVARTIMLGSAPDVTGQSVRGLETARIRLGVIQPKENISTFNDALSTLKSSSSYLYSDINDNRFWYDTRPTLRKTVEDRVRQISEDDAFFEIERRVKGLKKQTPFQGIHLCPSSSLDIPDEQSLRMVVLSPRQDHKVGIADSNAMEFVKLVLDTRGASPRIYKNMLVFAAPDSSYIKPLKDEAKHYLAWKSIQEDREALNLDAAQNRETNDSISRSNQGVDAKLQEAYSWVIVPRIDLTVSTSKILLDEERVGGEADSIVGKAARKLLNNEIVILQWAPATLKFELDRLLWLNDNDIQIKQLWDHLCKYCYLPRLASYEVLESAISRGLTSKDYFAIAGGIESGRYLDLRLGEGSPFVNTSDYLVKLDVAKVQLATDAEAAALERARREEGRGDTPESGLSGQDGSHDNLDGGISTGVKEPEQNGAYHPTDPVTFHLSSELDNTRVNRDVGKIVEEVVSQLENVKDCDVKIKLEITAHAEGGFDVPIQRTVSENCRTLNIEDFGFTR